MNNTLHTPGPWKIATFDGPNQYASIEAENESVRICDIPSWPCAVYEMRANARLIAAAPDLLDALDWALRQIEDDLDPDHQAAFDAALSTLRKAKGE
jgi:hypothetical protein